MKEVLVLRDLEQIKCISQTYRISILEAFEDQPATAKMISEKLDEPHAKINYHLKEMLKYGIIILVKEVAKLGIVEKFYLPVAKQFVVDSKTMKISDANVRESLNQYRLMIYNKISETFYNAIGHNDEQILKMNMIYDLYLTDDEANQLYDELKAVLQKYSDKESKKGNKYTVSYLVLPTQGKNTT